MPAMIARRPIRARNLRACIGASLTPIIREDGENQPMLA
jgi:hypothetical protein